MKKICYLSSLCLFMAATTVVSAQEQPPQTMTVSAATVEAVTAAPTVEAVQKRENTVLISPRTGMRYVVNNPNNVPIIFQTEALAPVTTNNVNRIVASNPAISEQSQQQAQQALLQMMSVNQQPQQLAVGQPSNAE